MSAYVCVREKEKKMKKRGLERERERDEIFFRQYSLMSHNFKLEATIQNHFIPEQCTQ